MSYIREMRSRIGPAPLLTPGSCVLVWNDKGELLMQRRTDTNDWGVIGGMLEPGETLEEAAARELMEEAGLQCRSLRFRTVLSGPELYYRYPHGDEVYNVTAVYDACETEGTPAALDEEGSELRYFDLTRPIPELNAIAEAILRLSGCFNGSGRPE